MSRTETNGKQQQRTAEVSIGCVKTPAERAPSARTTRVAMQYGLPVSGSPERTLDEMTVPIARGRIVLVVGPSGSGKSTALRQIVSGCRGGECVDRVGFRRGVTVLDAICPHRPLSEALELMNACGLGEARLWMRAYDELSDGQRFRARLARAIGRHFARRSPAPLVCDEFGTGLHKRLRNAIAFNLRKLVTRHDLSLVLACCDDDIAGDLQPDVTVRLLGGGRGEITSTKPRRKRVSFSRRLVIERGSKRDYDAFSAMHYRSTDELGFVDKVFVVRDGKGGPLVGIVVYSHGPLELTLRNRATNGRFLRNPRRLNREMRILRRLVVHPDVRGCGLGRRLVEETLPRVGTPFVECLASMGDVNPVFEKAGMSRIGTCALPATPARILGRLAGLDVDPLGRDFVMHVCRRPKVRQLVASAVRAWYAATTAGGERRVERQSPEFLAQIFRGLIGSRPVYFLWQRGQNKKKAG